jgi:hypothetical protein
MSTYITQEAVLPYYYNFRSYSINDDYSGYGLQTSYGEFHYTKYFMKDILDTTMQYHYGDYIDVTGYAATRGFQRDKATAYWDDDTGYAWFIESEDIRTQYRYRDLIESQTTPGYYTVMFRDWDGTLLKTQTVKQGESAMPPPDPYRDGFIFIEWNEDYTNIQASVNIVASYYSGNPKSLGDVRDSVTVIFNDWDGTALKTQSVGQGGTATPPLSLYREGYIFTGWSGSYENIQANRTITAQYEKISNDDPFTMGEDNYRFANDLSSFSDSPTYAIPLERFEEIYVPVDADQLYRDSLPWAGNCYGFAASSYAFEDYKLQHSDYQSGVSKTYNFSVPRTPNSELTKLIELYQISQNLPKVDDEHKKWMDNLSALVAAVNNEDGLIVEFWSTRGGGAHAVIAYGIEKTGNSTYAIKIYDNNQPDNKDLRINIDTSKSGSTGWSFNSADGEGYNSRMHDRISFTHGETVYNAVKEAKGGTKSPSATTRISVPLNAEITNSKGVSVEKINDAYRSIPIGVLPLDKNGNDPTPKRSVETWCVPEDVYTIDIPEAANDSVRVYNGYEAFEITANSGIAEVKCAIGSESYAKILEAGTSEAVEIRYATNETIDNPARFRTEKGGVFSAVVGESGKLMVIGDIEIRIISGAQNIEKLPGDIKTIKLQIGSPYMDVDGIQKEIYPKENVVAILEENRTLVPIRAIAEELGAEVAWENATKTVTIKRDGGIVELKIGNKNIDVNGKEIQSDVAPGLRNNRTMVPLRVVMEALNCQVDWEQKTKTVTIRG